METKAMEKAEFEKRFLNLVYQTDVVITAPNIAYHLGIGIEESQEQLLSLELNGVLQQESDDDGNYTYVMPNRPDPGSMPSTAAQLPAATGDGGRPPVSNNPADAPAAPNYAKAGAKGKNINGLVLNCVIPGLGSLICGDKMGGAMLGLFILGIVMIFAIGLSFSSLLGLLPIFTAYLWSIVAGVGLLSEK